jgi:regulator of RNase E activity RraB
MSSDSHYPIDADDDAIRKVAEGGSDMSMPMDIDFSIAMQDESACDSLAPLIATLGYVPNKYYHEESNDWSLYCTRRMLLTCEAVVAAQRQLDEVGRRFGGHCDGWGTIGNVEQAEE